MLLSEQEKDKLFNICKTAKKLDEIHLEFPNHTLAEITTALYELQNKQQLKANIFWTAVLVK